MGLKEIASAMHDRSQIPHGISYIDIIKDIKKFKNSNSNKRPIIVLNFPSLVYVTNASIVEILKGRCWKTILEEIKGFLDNLMAEDMQLVFFSEGYFVPRNQETWLANKTKQYWKECELIEEIESNADITKDKSHYQASAFTVYRDYLEQNLKSYGKWIKTFDSDVTFEMGCYAKENNVFAVMSDDTEFLIYEGNYRLWSVRKINFKDMTTKEFNKFNLRKALQLFPEHMPLFATLCGNDFNSDEKLKQFHNSFPEKTKIKCIAKYVTKVKNRNEDEDLEKISKRCGLTEEEIKLSYEKYDLNKLKKINDMNETQFMQKLRSNGFTLLYSILKQKPLRLGPYYEDVRKPILSVNQMDLCIWLHRCLLGVIFKEKQDFDLKCPLYTIKDHEKGYELVSEIPEYPKFDIPSFENLIFDKSCDYQTVHFNLLKWVLKSNELDTNILLKFQDVYVPVLLTLNFLVQEAQLSIDDTDVLLISIYDTISDRVPKIDGTFQTAHDLLKIDFLPFQLFYYFIRIQSLIIRFLSTIGLEKWKKYPDLNGVYFHHLYKKWQNMDEYAKIDRLNEIKDMRIYAKEEK
uniref:CSON000626 protein n=1 Tax=Culicoides sonorensis TaxID=179676 RepID=A0A336LQ01_CULSO